MRQRVGVALAAVAAALAVAVANGIDNSRLMGPRSASVVPLVSVGAPARVAGATITATRFDVAESLTPRTGQTKRPSAMPGAVLVVGFFHVDHGSADPRKGYCQVVAVEPEPRKRTWSTTASEVLVGLDRPKGLDCSGETREVDFAVAFEIPADAATSVRLRVTYGGESVEFVR